MQLTFAFRYQKSPTHNREFGTRSRIIFLYETRKMDKNKLLAMALAGITFVFLVAVIGFIAWNRISIENKKRAYSDFFDTYEKRLTRDAVSMRYEHREIEWLEISQIKEIVGRARQTVVIGNITVDGTPIRVEYRPKLRITAGVLRIIQESGEQELYFDFDQQSWHELGKGKKTTEIPKVGLTVGKKSVTPYILADHDLRIS